MLKIGILISIIVNFLFADYYISFDFTSVNGALVSYHFNCSKTIIDYNTKKQKFLFSIPVKSNNVYFICKKNQMKIINKLLRYHLNIYSYDKTFDSNIYSEIKGVFLPRLFDIIIKNNKAYFYLKE